MRVGFTQPKVAITVFVYIVHNMYYLFFQGLEGLKPEVQVILLTRDYGPS